MAEFMVDSGFYDLDVVMLSNRHQSDFFLESIVVKSFLYGTIPFICNSWLQSTKDHNVNTASPPRLKICNVLDDDRLDFLEELIEQIHLIPLINLLKGSEDFLEDLHLLTSSWEELSSPPGYWYLYSERLLPQSPCQAFAHLVQENFLSLEDHWGSPPQCDHSLGLAPKDVVGFPPLVTEVAGLYNEDLPSTTGTVPLNPPAGSINLIPEHSLPAGGDNPERPASESRPPPLSTEGAPDPALVESGPPGRKTFRPGWGKPLHLLFGKGAKDQPGPCHCPSGKDISRSPEARGYFNTRIFISIRSEAIFMKK
ncbi:hypothetical protein KSP40_PGU010391 [Platanthera guangdongensis]|uniref:PLAT domain-containing protein n=1 Tax=Platanthera guangdongensis TaxID=2320717 RepID=A0ABR2LDT0_9ASPA